MPQARGTDGTVDDLPVYIRAAFGHDRSWMAEGLCHPRNKPKVNAVAWKISRGETRIVDGQRYIGERCEAQVMPVCRECPQQWLCARYAIETDVRTGTWAVPFDYIRWLKFQPDALSIIDHARVNEVTVENAIRVIQGLRATSTTR